MEVGWRSVGQYLVVDGGQGLQVVQFAQEQALGGAWQAPPQQQAPQRPGQAENQGQGEQHEGEDWQGVGGQVDRGSPLH